MSSLGVLAVDFDQLWIWAHAASSRGTKDHRSTGRISRSSGKDPSSRKANFEVLMRFRESHECRP